MTGEARGATAIKPGGADAGKNPFQGVLDKENKPNGGLGKALSTRAAPFICADSTAPHVFSCFGPAPRSLGSRGILRRCR